MASLICKFAFSCFEVVQEDRYEMKFEVHLRTMMHPEVHAPSRNRTGDFPSTWQMLYRWASVDTDL